MNFEVCMLENNPCYSVNRTINVQGLMLHSVGCAQPDPDVFKKKWNLPSCEIGVHGIIGPYKVYQFMPWNHRGWHAGVAYKDGPSANDTHIGIEMTEPATIKYTGGASFVDNNPTLSEQHVKLCYENAVELFSKLCSEFGLNPLTQIISHREGHSKQIASNHGDPEHLWKMYPNLGYTMDRFRMDVKNFSPQSEPDPNVACDWAKEATAWAVEKGIFIGSNGKFNWHDTITREQVAVILYRMFGQE